MQLSTINAKRNFGSGRTAMQTAEAFSLTYRLVMDQRRPGMSQNKTKGQPPIISPIVAILHDPSRVSQGLVVLLNMESIYTYPANDSRGCAVTAVVLAGNL
jgi:hypothetical protein